MKPRIKFLGLIIDEMGIKMQPHTSKKIYLFLNKLESKVTDSNIFRMS